MTESDLGVSSMIEEATRLGEELVKREKMNKARLAKGLPPLPDPQTLENIAANKAARKFKGPMVVNGDEAIRLFEMRKAQMDAGIMDEPEAVSQPRQPEAADASAKAPYTNEDVTKAQKEAEAARRVSDMKNGRINHESVWSDGGQRLEGGDATSLKDAPSQAQEADQAQDTESASKTDKQDKPRKSTRNVRSDELQAFKDDLYYRLRESFAGLEKTLSDLQGRVSEIVTASSAATPPPSSEGEESFTELLSRKVPVTFDVGGAKMSFDAITVFHASPCITVVSKIGSASVKPKPGARLRMSYTMDGIDYIDDPVTYLGTRFELPMFGLSFVGFIRDVEAGDLDVDGAQA